MKTRTRFLLMGFVCVCLLFSLRLPAQRFSHVWDWCWEIVAFPEKELPPIGPIPIGCEVIDCCPGCPGPPYEITWQIRVSGAPLEGIELEFENLPSDRVRSLRLEGTAKFAEGTRIRVGRGDAVIRGLPADRKGTPAVGIPRLLVQKPPAGTKQAADWASGRTAEVSVIQRLGGIAVKEFRYGIRLRPCRRLPPPGPNTDIIRLTGNDASDNAVVLLDARRSGGCVDDELQRGTGDINVGSVLQSGTCRSEVIVFSDDDAMQLTENVNVWTNALGDILPQNLNPGLLTAPVTIWVMRGTFAATQARAVNDMARANQLYNTMNCGIAFNTAAINDATNNTNTPGLLNAACGNAANLRANIGFTASNLNVYYLNDPGARGWWCGNNTIIVAATADNESLAHEFGHGFTLGHTNTIAGMPAANLMVTGGTGRNNVTEGQCFRCNVNPASYLNAGGVRTGPTRPCPDGTTSPACPAITINIVPK